MLSNLHPIHNCWFHHGKPPYSENHLITLKWLARRPPVYVHGYKPPFHTLSPHTRVASTTNHGQVMGLQVIEHQSFASHLIGLIGTLVIELDG